MIPGFFPAPVTAGSGARARRAGCRRDGCRGQTGGQGCFHELASNHREVSLHGVDLKQRRCGKGPPDEAVATASWSTEVLKDVQDIMNFACRETFASPFRPSISDRPPGFPVPSSKDPGAGTFLASSGRGKAAESLARPCLRPTSREKDIHEGARRTTKGHEEAD